MLKIKIPEVSITSVTHFFLKWHGKRPHKLNEIPKTFSQLLLRNIMSGIKFNNK